MNRRSFFAFLPLAPFVLVSTAKAETKPDISEGKPIPEATRITIQGTKKREVKTYGSSGSSLTIGGWSMGEADQSKNLHMAVGDDGHLWLKANNGDWKRVVTE